MEEYVSSANKPHSTEEAHSKAKGALPSEDSQSKASGDGEAVTAGRLESSIRHMSARGNGSLHAATMLQAQRTHSNRAVQRVVQRMAQEGSSGAETEPLLPNPTLTGPKSTRVNVQRSVWDDDGDLENDFWGTKKYLGKRWGGTVDAASSAVWNLASAVPGIGTVVGAAGTGIDLMKFKVAMANGDVSAANRFKNDAEFDALGMIPGVGDGLGAVAGGYDAGVAIGRAFGADPNNETPLSSDLYHKIPDLVGPRARPTLGEEDLPREGGGTDGGAPAFDPDGPNQTPLFPGPLAPELLNPEESNQTPFFPGPLAPEFLDAQ